jgi:DNA repair protein RecO (recombination protein O)
MGERVDDEPAFILHTRPWRETSLIVDVLSRHHGRIGLVARGARRQGSALKARLISFQPLHLSWFGKNALRTLHSAEWQGGNLNLRGHGLMCGFYLNELLLRLLPEGDAHETLFDHYQSTLENLNQQASRPPIPPFGQDHPPGGAGNTWGGPACFLRDVEPILRRFELDLLSELGYAQPLGHTAENGDLQAAARYGYEFGVGVVSPKPGGPSYLGRTLLDLANNDLTDPITLAEGKLLMRALLAHYLGEKPLATRQLLIDLQKL